MEQVTAELESAVSSVPANGHAEITLDQTNNSSEIYVAKIVVGVLAIGGTFFILLIREFGEFIDEVSPYNWGESEVLKDEYKR